MRLVTGILAVLLLLAASQPATAELKSGAYPSIVDGGQLHLGKAVQSRPDKSYRGDDEANNMQSYLTTGLTDQWQLSCSIQQELRGGSGGMDEWGNGLFVYNYFFTGGEFTLASGPWGDGQTGSVDSMNVTLYRQYRNALLEYVWSSHQVHGHFADGYSFTLTDDLAPGFDSAEIWTDDQYPPCLPRDCNPSSRRDYGIYSQLDNPVLVITSPTPTRPTTWGQLKAVYR